MLLTKPLTSLLNSSLAPPLTTLMLITPSGQILASASALPSTILRSRATLAIGIWGLYQSGASSIRGALPTVVENDNKRDKEGERRDGEKAAEVGRVQMVTLQLTLGILTIRLLTCGLLVLGLSDPPPVAAPSSTELVPGSSPPEAALLGQSSPPAGTGSQTGSLRIKPNSGDRVAVVGSPERGGNGMLGGKDGGKDEERASRAPSECGSVTTLGGGGREVQRVRRRVEEVGRWLDGELRGYRVCEGI